MKNKITKVLIIGIFTGFSLLNAYTIHKAERILYLNSGNDAEVCYKINFSATGMENSIKVPLAYPSPKNITVQINGTEVPDAAMAKNPQDPCLSINIEGISGTNDMEIKYTAVNVIDWDDAGPADYKSYEFETEIENNCTTTIESFTLNVVLPENWAYHRVTGSIPKFTKKDPKAPFEISKTESGLSCLSISKSPLDYNDDLYLKFIFKENKKSSAIIFAAIALAGLYLFSFRHLLTHKENNNQMKKEDK